jgi:cytochrome c peroxidase
MKIGNRIRSAVLLCAAVCSGCGGGGSDSAPSSGVSPNAGTAAANPLPAPSLPAAGNRAPYVSKENPDPQGIGGHAFAYDPTQGGTTFRDLDHDPLTYSIKMYDPSGSLTVSGGLIAGTLPATGQIGVAIEASDGKEVATDSFWIVIEPNSPPLAASPNLAVFTSAGAQVNYDPTKGGSAFWDPDGDKVTYELSVTSAARGLSVEGTSVVGALDEVGVVTFALRVSDGYGAQSTDAFSIAVAAAEPGDPVLPASTYVYADAELSRPHWFVLSSVADFPFMSDTTVRSGNAPTNAGATLGRVLFYDKRLSITNTHSCSSCHVHALNFGAPERYSVGVLGVPMKRHSMALGNVRYRHGNRFFSDERVYGLENVVLLPITTATELGNYMPLLEAKLAATSFYPALFAMAFGTPEITAARIEKALAQFLRSLISYRSKFDRAFPGGDPWYPIEPATVLSAQELRGHQLFIEAKCYNCHQVEFVQTMDWPANNGLDSVITDGGANGFGSFRAPSLRNIVASAPYMHDGRFATLREVIDHYDHGVKPGFATSQTLLLSDGQPRLLNLSEDDKAALEAYLQTLTDPEFLSDPKFADPFQ